MEFLKVNVEEYVKEGLKKGTMVPTTAIKFARIVAHLGEVGQKVETYTQNGLLEKVATVELDNETQKPGWIATKADADGKVIIDDFGNKNQWIITDSTFQKKYEIDPENPALFKPKGGPQVFVEIQDNIMLEQWGSEMNIEKGGYINITNPEDMYGISKRDFEDTYCFVWDSDKK